jgi:hypothetical protein
MLVAIAALTLAAAGTSPATPQATTDATPEVTATATAATVQADLALGSAVVNRQAQPMPEKVVAGQTIYAVTQITGPGGGYVEHVWTCNGKEVARHYLPIGQSKRWRTWSRHKVTTGQYHVEILGQDGTRLQEASFEVVAPVAPAEKAQG